MSEIAIVGGGIGGLATALALGRGGHAVTLLDRDDLAPAADVDAAFAEERRGAPQARHTHGFLARLRRELDARFPDVRDDLLAAGGASLPLTAPFPDERPGDDELTVLAARRTTVEWVLRQKVAREPTVSVRGGVGVTGLVADGEVVPATVTGVALDDGSSVAADAVVIATGRRSAVPDWLAAVGATVEETVHESGLVYMTRWYRRPGGVELVEGVRLADDHGFVKYLAIPGDGEHFSVTLGVTTGDAEMRALLADPDRYDEVARLLPGPASLFDQGGVEPTTDVLPMAGLINRIRRFRDADGRPVALGVHVVGDAHTCTNPIYGRGTSLAVVQAGMLADAFAAHPGTDPAAAEARARAYEDACGREVEPWFELAVQGDAMGNDPGGRAIREARTEATADSAAHDAHKAIARVFAAGGQDPVVGRGILRLMNLLATPSELMADPEFLAQAMTILGDPDTYPVRPPPDGPDRDSILALALPA